MRRRTPSSAGPACCRASPTSTRAVFAWEQANIFAGWVCLGRAESFAEPGTQHAVETGAGSALVVRGEDDELRVFANVCRHRGHELVACGTTVNRRNIVCPYHAWTYKLDGSLRVAPGDFRKVEDFDTSQFGLVELSGGQLARLALRRPERRGRALRRARCRARGDRGAVPAREPRHRRHPLLRARDELEDHRRELPGVLPLLLDPPRAVPGQPAAERREPRARRRVDGRLDGPDGPRGDDVVRRQPAAAT